MCGVAGILNLDAGGAPRRDELERMIRALRHRGPDGDGFYHDDSVGLAHARLSIIDLTTGAQPIHNEDKTVWVVFNGEIFNYIELRSDLERRGHRFYTHSDTEVLVHLYEEYGEAFAHQLNGQYAIALWDRTQHKLLLCRDRVGIAPLFYTTRNGRLLFASEVKALLPVFDAAPALNPAALDQIFTFWTTVGADTVFKDVWQVRPGEMVVAHDGTLRRQTYWDWDFPQPHEYFTAPEETQADQLRELLLDATRLRLRADVPVGVYLSGGLDSAIIATLVRDVGAPLRTFSIGFEDVGLDESEHQRVMSAYLGTDHSQVRCSPADVGDAFERTLWHTESPLLRTAPVPMRLLSQRVHEQGYKVVLTGEGADEVFGGYDLFKEAKIRLFWARNPDSRWRPLLLKRLYPYLEFSPGRAQAFAQAFYGDDLRNTDSPWFAHAPRWTTTAHCKLFYAADFAAHLREGARDALRSSVSQALERWHPFNRAQYLEAKTLMGGYLLSSQGDRMLMANAVEGRFPYLDHRVIEFAARVPPRLKMKVLREKYLLKQAMRARLPDAIRARHKQPYRAPDIPAFFTRPLPFVDELMSEDTVRRYGYFDAQKVALLARKARAGRVLGFKDNMAFVGILSTQLWHHTFVENFPRARRAT
jgi:asparagine synthase (glutamine-hydrolysing)